MPNWCTNHIHITGDRVNINNLWSSLNVGDETNLMDALPIPEDIGDNWYDWCIQNWGTKWPMEVNTADKDDDRIYLQGNTAWSPPLALLAHIATWWKVTCEVTYDEMGMDFCGAAVFHPDGTHSVSDGPISDFMPEVDEDDVDAWHEAFMETLENRISYHETEIGA